MHESVAVVVGVKTMPQINSRSWKESKFFYTVGFATCRRGCGFAEKNTFASLVCVLHGMQKLVERLV